jgi:hypothetical protein
MCAERHREQDEGEAARPGPHIRLALLRLAALSRAIRSRLQGQRLDPVGPRRSWERLRPALPGELQAAVEHTLGTLQSLHEGVFQCARVARVQRVREHIDVVSAGVGLVLDLHRETAAALPLGSALRAALLEIIERPVLQLADFFDAMQRAMEGAPSGSSPDPDEIELRLSIPLDFGDQIESAERFASSPPTR